MLEVFPKVSFQCSMSSLKREPFISPYNYFLSVTFTTCLMRLNLFVGIYQVIQQKSEECDHIKFLIEEKDSEEEAFYEDLDGFEENGTQETRISPYTFCKAFPFHLMFDKDLMLTQCGNAIFRVLPQVGLLINSLFYKYKSERFRRYKV